MRPTFEDINNFLAHVGVGALVLIVGSVIAIAAVVIWIFWKV